MEVLEKINVFTFKNLLLKLTFVSLFMANDFILLTCSSSKSIKLFCFCMLLPLFLDKIKGFFFSFVFYIFIKVAGCF